MAVNGRFTERAQQSIILSQRYAQQLGHNYVGTEHLLLGLLQEGEGIGAKALKNLGIEISQLQEKVIDTVGKGLQQPQLVGFTPRTKRVFELSFEVARSLGHSYIGTEHLLLGLIAEGEGIAAKVLIQMGINLDKAKEEVLKLLNNKGPQNNHPNLNNPQKGISGTPTLDKYGRDLNQMVREGKIDPVIGRNKETQRVIQILSRRTKNNPCLVGEPGVGKTAVAEGLAQQIVEGNIPEILKDKRVITLDISSMLAGAKYRGEFEDRLKKVMEEIRQAGNVILFIDEIHTMVGAGAAEGAIDAANILKPALARGELQTIGATTIDEYRKHIEKDAALERRFQPIMIEEPSVEDTIKILQGLRDKYEAHHRVKITDEALTAAGELSHRYITDRYLPDKAIDLIDEAASKVRLTVVTAPSDLKDLEETLAKLSKEKEEAISLQDFERAALLRDKEKSTKEELEKRQVDWKDRSHINKAIVDTEEIAEVVADWTGIPVKKLQQEESERLLNMEKILHERVIGQEEAVKSVSKAIRRARVGLKDPKKPIGSFIFLGPTGVGKTELSRALAEAMFGEEDAMLRIDMSEYMEKHTVSRLIGSPPGYVGFDEGGQLTEKVRRKPYSVILFDEIEKAHPDVFNVLLQILDDGRLTDAKGKTVDFKNTIIIMTSNVGAHTIKKQKSLGFAVNEKDVTKNEYEKMKDNVMGELRRSFRPEFLNRIDDIIVFHSLDREYITQIVDLMIGDLKKRLDKLDIQVEITDKAKAYIADQGYDPQFGARPLKRAIQKLIEDKISEELLKGNVMAGNHVEIDFEKDDLVVTKK
ncbi:ATP-dependent Clp protease ATP-binding subunit [Clostridium formicaceticum]|uniref:ATP-dependent Clp protease ATP-binding subunit ClpC n=1 Tax=Clostridium formicaceticum TaxID=1497 RepID=A0AAC9WI34_9CLOT|nr:ATP-dependent Clp protease ATP-binding subunit [Clostridium formicaceticum]AOY75138.1 ATP-dependent Clp protease ATP-binding subunit ClpC [Clostridium formicaceticum]ARE89563.1 Negative regulator of genetic competence ClpC/MecB [Clostridium formicaceticum]